MRDLCDRVRRSAERREARPRGENSKPRQWIEGKRERRVNGGLEVVSRKREEFKKFCVWWDVLMFPIPPG